MRDRKKTWFKKESKHIAEKASLRVVMPYGGSLGELSEILEEIEKLQKLHPKINFQVELRRT